MLQGPTDTILPMDPYAPVPRYFRPIVGLHGKFLSARGELFRYMYRDLDIDRSDVPALAVPPAECIRNFQRITLHQTEIALKDVLECFEWQSLLPHANLINEFLRVLMLVQFQLQRPQPVWKKDSKLCFDVCMYFLRCAVALTQHVLKTPTNVPMMLQNAQSIGA